MKKETVKFMLEIAGMILLAVVIAAIGIYMITKTGARDMFDALMSSGVTV